MSFYTKEDKQIISEKLQKLGIDKYDKNKYKTETTIICKKHYTK